MVANEFTRRGAVLGSLALGACANAPAQSNDAANASANDPRFAAIEARIGGRVGVAAYTAGSGRMLTHRANERFAMCSTFKWPLAAQMLHQNMTHAGLFAQQLEFDEGDLLDYAPAARANLARGWMTVEEMTEAIVVLSDNTCANILLERKAFWPEGFTRWIRRCGDEITRLDRFELELNEVPAGDERDTTTPASMVRLVRRLLLTRDVILDDASQERLIGWMIESPTGRQRLRAGLPSDWRVGDKTGTWNGPTNATNDVAIAWPPGRDPIIIASYLSASTVEPAERNAAHAEIARIIATEWA